MTKTTNKAQIDCTSLVGLIYTSKYLRQSWAGVAFTSLQYFIIGQRMLYRHVVQVCNFAITRNYAKIYCPVVSYSRTVVTRVFFLYTHVQYQQTNAVLVVTKFKHGCIYKLMDAFCRFCFENWNVCFIEIPKTNTFQIPKMHFFKLSKTFTLHFLIIYNYIFRAHYK